MKRVLVLFASREGQTEKIAIQISSILKAADAAVDLVDAAHSVTTAQLDLGSYDLLVFGASMHAGGLERELVRFINSHAEQIDPQTRSFFLVLLSAATKDPELRAESLADARKKAWQKLAIEFEDTEMIAGALTYSKYPRPLKWLMRSIAAKAGEDTDTSRDYEYTDWEQVAQYAERLLHLGEG
jgi:menaquinone-dependent protoporphyrinogen oxidase